MKVKKILLGILVISTLLISFFSFFSVNTLAIDDINYVFNKDVYYDNSSITYITDNNVRNPSFFSNIFNGSYSFTNEVEGTSLTDISFIETLPLHDENTWVSVNETFNSHDNILNIKDNSNTGLISMRNSFTIESDITIEFWFAINDLTTTNGYVFSLAESTTNTRILTAVNDDDIEYHNGGGWIDIKTDFVIVNDWIHIKLILDDTSNNLDYYVNGVLEGNNLNYFSNTVIGVDTFQVATGTNDILTGYLDGVGYAWFSNYTEGVNFIPSETIDTTLLEIDRYEFTLDGVGDRITSGRDNPPGGWEDVESGADQVNIGLFDGDSNNLGVEIFSTTAPNNFNSILKDDFGLTSQRLNVTFGFMFETLLGTISRLNLEVKSSATNLVVWIEIRGSGHLRWYTSDPPGTFITLRTDLTTDIYYEFNIYVDYSSDLGILLVSENGVLTNTFSRPLTNNLQEGLSSIEVEAIYSDGNIFFELDYVGIYDNSTSIAKDLGYTVHDLHKPVGLEFALDSSHNNLAIINASGSFDLIYAPLVDISQGLYFIPSIFGQITDGFVEMSNNSRLFNFYDTDLIRQIPIVVAYLNNGSKNFVFNSLLLEGAKLNEGGNTYWLEYSHDNILTNISFFRVDNSNRLNFNLTIDDNNLEFIQAIFNINNILSNDRALFLDSNKNNLGFAELRVVYPTVSDIIVIPNKDTRTRTIITQNETITNFVFLFSDNNIDAIQGISTGFIDGLELVVMSGITTSIVSLSLLGMIVPLILIIVPTFLFSSRLGKDTIVPLFLIFSLILVIMNIIPIWLFFIIAISSMIFIFSNKGKIKEFK